MSISVLKIEAAALDHILEICMMKTSKLCFEMHKHACLNKDADARD